MHPYNQPTATFVLNSKKYIASLILKKLLSALERRTSTETKQAEVKV